ncbi:plasmolipin isoform X2 [Eleutherodactylus coqui]|uniref:Plasmolipin n=1 Tax=Eleutherodactylus coqui TaxID=57060 RepID=A0A8J6ETF2_ELECQ|nr:hypothetical protein GDO78_003341 [Eleutherodactylus coqui]
MAEFPAKVSTHTSTPEVSGIRGCCPRPDLSLLWSIPGIFLMVEIVFGFLVWALIASTNHYWVPAYGWVLFVSIFCWLVTIILFLIILLQLPRRIPVVPWPLTMFIYHVVATLLYITAFITCAASVSVNAFGAYNYNRRAAASFFACVVMIAYGVSTFFSFSEWRGSRSAASDNA